MNQLLFQRSWLFRLCRAFWWFFVFPCCFFLLSYCSCSCDVPWFWVCCCIYVDVVAAVPGLSSDSPVPGWCFFGVGHFRCCHQEHRNSLRDCGMCCQPSLQMGSPLQMGLLEHQHSTIFYMSCCNWVAMRSFQMLVFLKVLGFTMEGAKDPICRRSVGRLFSSLKHDSRTKSTWWIPLVVQLWIGKLQIVAWVIIKRSPTSTVAWIVKTHGWKQNERPTVCKEILRKLPTMENYLHFRWTAGDP